MVAIKNMEMPKYCWDYDNDDNEDNVCPLFDSCKHRNMYGLNPGIKNDDCPLVQIEEPKIGYWVEHKIGISEYSCSCCDKGEWEKNDIEEMTNCPYCGAKIINGKNET